LALRAHPDHRLGGIYRAKLGGALELEMPFEGGLLGASVTRVAFAGRRVSPAADFDATLLALDWRIPIRRGAFRLGVGPRVGNFLMAFDDTIINPGLRDESELFLGVSAAASARLGRGFGVNLTGWYGQVHLHAPLRIASAAAGIEYTMSTPGWLRDLLW
jgi:hypothetical protein